MTTRDAPRWSCTSCLLEIRHRPVFHVGLAFCCAGCVAGGPCICSYDDVLDEELVEASPVIDARIAELAGVD
jgi:hypothetical protein